MGSSSGKRQYAEVWCSGGQPWRGTGEHRHDDSGSERRIPRQKLGSNKKKVPYFSTLSRVLVVIRAPGKMLIGLLVSKEGCSLRLSPANM